jgi:hypothetical protein
MAARNHHRCRPVQPLFSGDDSQRLWNPPDVDLDLAQVRAFVAVVDHAHFGRAAVSLTLSQQALSKRVARLEAALGPLLVRERTGIVPTSAGERFLPAARQLLEVADRAVVDARDQTSRPLRVDVWGEVHTPGAELVPIGANVGLPDLVRHVVADPEIVTCVVADWPLDGIAGVRVVPITPPPRYAWSAVWRATDSHPALPLVLSELRNWTGAGAARDRVTSARP